MCKVPTNMQRDKRMVTPNLAYLIIPYLNAAEAVGAATDPVLLPISLIVDYVLKSDLFRLLSQ